MSIDAPRDRHPVDVVRPGPLHARMSRGRRRPLWRAYLALTKPRVIRLLLVTTVPTMILAVGGWPDTFLVLHTMIGGTLAAGSASAFNMYFDRDIDAVMQRTRDRPLVTGEITPARAVVFASALGVLSVVWLMIWVGLLAAALTVAAILLYVVLYTLILKRRTDQNIIWGGAAGCMPVLIGWAAATGTIGLPAVLLFFVVFLWTPAHYWPLSLTYRDDYAEVDVPMLSVTKPARTVARRGLGYTIAVLVLALVLAPAAGLGWVYLAAVAIVGAGFLGSALHLLRAARRGDRVEDIALGAFRASIVFLAVFFFAIAVDPFLTAL